VTALSEPLQEQGLQEQGQVSESARVERFDDDGNPVDENGNPVEDEEE